jgi:hypothetical protein
MASILRFDNWEDTNGNTVGTVDSNGNLSMPSVNSLVSSSIKQPRVTRHNSTLRNGITLSNVTGLSYTDDLSSYITTQTFAISIAVGYQHNGGANHGYWNGYFIQSGESAETKKGYWSEAHYDWYFNRLEKEIIIPWNPSGSTNLETYTTGSYNTNTGNTYFTTIKAVWTNE